MFPTEHKIAFPMIGRCDHGTPSQRVQVFQVFRQEIRTLDPRNTLNTWARLRWSLVFRRIGEPMQWLSRRRNTRTPRTPLFEIVSANPIKNRADIAQGAVHGAFRAHSRVALKILGIELGRNGKAWSPVGQAGRRARRKLAAKLSCRPAFLAAPHATRTAFA